MKQCVIIPRVRKQFTNFKPHLNTCLDRQDYVKETFLMFHRDSHGFLGEICNSSLKFPLLACLRIYMRTLIRVTCEALQNRQEES